MTTILITGASGLIGTRLTELLVQRGYRVVHLGRTKKRGHVPSYTWDPVKGEIERQAFDHVTAVVHLAGAGVADRRWTQKRKDEIKTSRTQSSMLLCETLSRITNEVKSVVSASGIGYYGWGDEIKTEDSPPGSDFLASVVKEWESSLDPLLSLGIRLVKIRTGIVLSRNGGALEKMATPVKWYAGAPLGSGQQQMSWIHIDDLCTMFIKAIEDKTTHGVYNGTGPYAVTNRDFTKAMARVLHRPLWLPHVPGFLLQIILGQMSEMVLNGCAASSQRMQQAGFKFQFPELNGALSDLLVTRL